jgi:hypothetical protein
LQKNESNLSTAQDGDDVEQGEYAWEYVFVESNQAHFAWSMGDAEAPRGDAQYILILQFRRSASIVSTSVIGSVAKIPTLSIHLAVPP